VTIARRYVTLDTLVAIFPGLASFCTGSPPLFLAECVNARGKIQGMDPRQKDWTNLLFLVLSPIAGIGGTILYASRFGVQWWEPTLCLTLFFAIGLSIGSGYHRYFSHRAYECHPAVESVMLFFGAMALQNSALQWSRDHREHHRFVDTDRDPYNIKRGFLWAHILWIFYKQDPDRNFDAVPDLKRNPRVMWQHRYARVIGIGVGLGLPTLVGAFFGRPLGGLLWGGFLRIVLVHHTTFFINSLAHMWGARPYSTENTARDNWFLAFFTHGEGFHNFHHAFPSDFRNGIRWYHWDPNKWLIQSFRATRLARNLRVTPPPLVENAKLKVAAAVTEARLARVPTGIADDLRARAEQARARMEETLNLWKEAYARACELKAAKRTGQRPPSETMREIRRQMREYERRFRATRLEWKAALDRFTDLPAVQGF
jgi:stearoyl-CoA desaturase (delta-9 desaturase)